VTPSGQRWNSYLQQIGTGAGGVVYTAAEAAWAALASGEQDAWDAAAAALTPVITDVAQKDAGGVAGTAKTAGEVWFIGQYALAQVSLASTPGATPPTYA
jgi:hypothetical protein